MSAQMSTWPEAEIDAAVLETVGSALRTEGVVVIPDALPAPVLAALAALAQRCDDLVPAGVGRHDEHRRREDIRRDRIAWLDPADPVTVWWFDWIESLRLGLNRLLLLGLFDYECHLARYPPGAFYRRHLDAFRGRGVRRVSTVLYLNPGWDDRDGGELVVYRPDETATGDNVVALDADLAVDRVVVPRHGTLVLFLSEEIPHEVRPTARERHSIAGWFRVNGSRGSRVDPPLLDPAV